MPLSQFSDQLIYEQFASTQYQLLHKTGEGGFGKVFKAIQTNTGQAVAIKFLAIESHCDEQQKKRYIERFKRETALSSQLQHPNIVRLLDKGQINDNLLYGVFEYVEGQSLREHLIQEGALNAVDAKEVMLQVLDALVHAHQNGIVHRDIKPANILIGDADRVWVADFGLARSHRSDSTLTRTGAILGTPAYMSPEQARSEDEEIGPTSDVYSLGATLYAALTGRSPHTRRGGPNTIFARMDTNEITSPLKLGIDLPTELETIRGKAMEVDPRRRYPHAGALAADLDRFLHHLPIRARAPGRLRRARLWARRNRVLFGIFVLGAILLSGLLGYSGHRATLRWQAEEAVARGDERFDRGEFFESVSAYEEASRIDPDRAEISRRRRIAVEALVKRTLEEVWSGRRNQRIERGELS